MTAFRAFQGARARYFRSLSALLLISGGGCLRFVNPVAPPEPACRAEAQAVPAASRDHVHVLLLNGLDPLELGNMAGVADYVRRLGFSHTEYAQFFEIESYREEFRRVHAQDPDARLVIVGFSLGGFTGEWLSEQLAHDHVPVALLVLVDGKGLSPYPHEGPGKAAPPEIVNVIAPSVFETTPKLDGAKNVPLAGVWHFGAPAHHVTLTTLAHELTAVAAAPVPPANDSRPGSANLVH